MKTIKRISYGIAALIVWCALLAGCKKTSSCDYEIEPGPEAQQEIQTALNTIEEGCKIELGDGVFELTNRLTMDSKSDITIEGRSPENTILSFEGQVSGGEGIFIENSDNIVLRDFTIRDAIGDALKIMESHSIVMHKIHTVWSGEPSVDNGSYGLYPVLSSNILIEECYAYGASDAGIYVGQSDKAIVRNSIAEGNVAGIQIENTTNADVYGNAATDNAAGILVFDLPGLTQSGASTRVFDNIVENNIRGNFAPGGIVSELPAGTGILVLSTKEVEVFENELSENNVVGTAVASYLALLELGLVSESTDPMYNPFPQDIYIHDNSYSRSDTYPAAEEQSDFGNFLVQSFGSNPIPDIILDGIHTPGTKPSGTICIQNNSGNSFVNLNLPDFPDNNPSFDQSPHNCSLDPLPPVEIDVPQI